MNTIIFLCCLLTTTISFQGEHFVLSPEGNRFQPVDNTELLYKLPNIDIVSSCAQHCLKNTFCRTFNFDFTTHQCHLYERSVDTGTLMPANSSTRVGWIEIITSMFTSYNASADQCLNSRYLSVDLVTGRCQCALHTFWNGSICLSQKFAGETCVENNWCRNDLNIGCVASICVVIPTTSTTTTSTTTTPICTTSITFNDIPNQSNTSTVIPNGYKNLNWTNAEYINAWTTPVDSGYRTAARTGTFVMHNNNGNNVTISTVNGTRFSFDSLNINSAWYDFLYVTMRTYRAGQLTSSGTYKTAVAYVLWVYCNFCTDIDTITFGVEYGIMNVTRTQSGTQFTITNLCISFGR